jgi:putative heme iron utilization protein
MRPSPAEIVRTLVAGRLPGLVHLACRPGLHHARHATDAEGRVLLLVPVVSDLAAALGAEDRAVAVVLDVLDLPPAAGAPSLGRALVSGWARRLAGDEARAAAVDFATVEPTGDLLDVGTRFRLFRFEVAEARWRRAGELRRIDPAAYAEAEPDPLHPVEAGLLAHLGEDHAARLTDYLRRQLGLAAGPADHAPRIERIDRYGMLVAFGRPGARRRARLAFGRRLTDRAELNRLLAPVLRAG